MKNECKQAKRVLALLALYLFIYRDQLFSDDQFFDSNAVYILNFDKIHAFFKVGSIDGGLLCIKPLLQYNFSGKVDNLDVSPVYGRL